MSSLEPSEIKIKELISLFDKKKFDKLLKLSNELLDNNKLDEVLECKKGLPIILKRFLKMNILKHVKI